MSDSSIQTITVISDFLALLDREQELRKANAGLPLRQLAVWDGWEQAPDYPGMDKYLENAQNAAEEARQVLQAIKDGLPSVVQEIHKRGRDPGLVNAWCASLERPNCDAFVKQYWNAVHDELDLLLKLENDNARNQRTTSNATADAKDNSDVMTVPSVDERDIAILRALEKRSNHRLTYDQIETITKNPQVSRRTIADRMPRLKKEGLVAYPRGIKQGATITEHGKQLLQQIDRIKS